MIWLSHSCKIHMIMLIGFLSISTWERIIVCPNLCLKLDYWYLKWIFQPGSIKVISKFQVLGMAMGEVLLEATNFKYFFLNEGQPILDTMIGKLTRYYGSEIRNLVTLFFNFEMAPLLSFAFIVQGEKN